MSIAFVQAASNTAAAGSVTVTLGSNTTAGNCLVACIALGNSSSTSSVSSVKLGGAADNWASLKAVGDLAVGAEQLAVWADPNCAGGQTAVAITQSTGLVTMAWVFEFSGLATSSILDQSATFDSAGGTNSTFSVTSGTTTQASELAIGCAYAFSTTITGPSSPWVNESTLSQGSDRLQASYDILSSTGTVTYSGSFGAAQFNGQILVTLLATAAASIPWATPRPLPVPSLSPAPWAQRDRRDANTVATAANPLASPLDTAWQADGQYSHLYGDSHLRDRRQYFYQRNYISPPGLLATAELENELLGGAGTAQRYGFPAYYDRREVPQQPARLADPLLIQTAELENELLGGADTARHCLTAAWYDRREVPQQRLYISDPSADPPQNNLDPLLAGQDYLDGHQHPAATHCDRREVPQQRLYISDPSFYSSSAPTDPLTVAWGAGGSYWHLYNRASDITDRREVPQQRLYVSDPLLLTTAQLENELLGGAETGKYYRAPATHAARWWMPQQPPRLADPLLIQTAELENELLGGGDTIRYYLAAAYWDRREVPEQRAYVSDPSFYPSGAVTDPLTVAWGAGGPYWHLYNRAADVTDRREVPQQRSYVADPLLLATALLENELLGGAGTAMRYLLPATHYDRRQAGQQRAYPAAPDIPFNPVLAAWAEGLRRALLAATHADRRLYPQQRLYFPPPAPPPPFTVGLLTAVTAPGSALTAADVALAILTAVTAASGGTDTTAP